MFHPKRKSTPFFKVIALVQVAILSAFFIIPSGVVQAQTFSVLSLPKPGAMVTTSEKFDPLLIKGISLHKENPLVFDFILDPGNSGYSDDQIKIEGQRLIKYFLAALTVPEKDLWVNLSPYEKDRIIPEGFGQTEMGRDLLAQDYILKQLSASLIYPEKDLGKEFWSRVYRKAKEVYGTTDIPLNTFNKVWIVPDTAVIVETKTTAYITRSHLKVMLEEDYVSLNENRASEVLGTNYLQEQDVKNVSKTTSSIVRDIILPEIEKEVNEGKNFAQLRQIYYSLLLATWFKINLKDNILNQIYSNQYKILGINIKDKADKEKIYQQYLAAFRAGVFNYIKEDWDETTKEIIPRKYFSGGFGLAGVSKSLQTLDGATPAGKAELSAATEDRTQVVVTSGLSRPEQDAVVMQGELMDRLINNSVLPEVVRKNIASGVIVSQIHGDIIEKMIAIGEQDKLAQWDQPGSNDESKRAFLDQIIQLDQNYPGGLSAYKGNVRTLLENSRKAINPFEGFEPAVPVGTNLSDKGKLFGELAEEGLKIANKVSFVLVAGGLGDRLGYKGIKVSIPVDLVTMKPYLQNYIESIVAMQEKSNTLNGEDRKVPLTIMTSEDTHDLTIQLLRENNYFGMDGLTINPTKEQVDRGDIQQIVILKQGSVPAVANNDADFVLDEQNPYHLQAKPHGHGDIHMLIQNAGLAKYWNSQGIRQTVFIQDTNGQVFNAILPALGNSLRLNLDLNFLTVPRGAGEAAGSIVQMNYGLVDKNDLGAVVENVDSVWERLILDGFITPKGILTDKFKKEGLTSDYAQAVGDFLNKSRNNKSQTFNVEYNELGPFLVKTVSPKGDVADPITGKSPYPGNLNVFIIDNTTYLSMLRETGGIFGEFINPKYADTERTKFKSPARAESMMQDYAKYRPGELVGFTNFDRLDAFSPVKNKMGEAREIVKKGNAPDAMPKGEFDKYQLNRRSFAAAGVAVNVEGNPRVVHGIPINDGAKIILSPSFAVSQTEVERKVNKGSVSDKSVVYVEGENVRLENVTVDGTLLIQVAQGASLTVRDAVVVNQGWNFVDLTDEEMNPDNKSVPQYLQMRGYRVEKMDQLAITISESGDYQFRSDNKLYRLEGNEWKPYSQGQSTSQGTLTDTSVVAAKENDYLNRLAALPDLGPVQEVIDSLSPSDREIFDAKRAALITSGQLNPLNPTVENPGGIDFNPNNIKMEIDKQNGGVKVEFDPKLLEEIRSQGIEGFVPVILNIQRVQSVVPLLSQNVDQPSVDLVSI